MTRKAKIPNAKEGLEKKLERLNCGIFKFHFDNDGKMWARPYPLKNKPLFIRIPRFYEVRDFASDEIAIPVLGRNESRDFYVFKKTRKLGYRFICSLTLQDNPEDFDR